MRNGFNLVLERKSTGFTLAELLIALVILGVIATFTIPKILTAQQNSDKSARAKEVAGMMAGAYQAAVNKKGNTSVSSQDLIDNMNYVRVQSTAFIDTPDGADLDCSAGGIACFTLHVGGTLGTVPACGFPDATNLAATAMIYDADGARNATAQSDPGAAIQFFFYRNGRITTSQNILSSTNACLAGVINPPYAADPTWFSWQ